MRVALQAPWTTQPFTIDNHINGHFSQVVLGELVSDVIFADVRRHDLHDNPGTCTLLAHVEAAPLHATLLDAENRANIRRVVFEVGMVPVDADVGENQSVRFVGRAGSEDTGKIFPE